MGTFGARQEENTYRSISEAKEGTHILNNSVNSTGKTGAVKIIKIIRLVY
jgi:hypothetical protein